jgi:hypothetical protein
MTSPTAEGEQMRDRLLRASKARTGMLFLLVALAGGCQWKQPKPLAQQRFDASSAAIIHVSPKDIIKLIQKNLPAEPLSISVESAEGGIVLTGWKEYEGAVHIVRRWRERTRFKINVLPDFNDPLGTSHVEVFDETEERPSDPQPWYPNPDLRRPERSEELLRMIVEWAGPEHGK